jgi:hypothetical protein
MDETKTHGYKLASKGRRLIASLIEGVIFILLNLGIYLVLGKSICEYWNSDFEFIEIVYSAISGLIVGAIFYPIFIANLGHRLFNLKVISEDTGEDRFKYFDLITEDKAARLAKAEFGSLLSLICSGSEFSNSKKNQLKIIKPLNENF